MLITEFTFFINNISIFSHENIIACHVFQLLPMNKNKRKKARYRVLKFGTVPLALYSHIEFVIIDMAIEMCCKRFSNDYRIRLKK